ncbi:MAG: hypothetical protein Q7R70_07120 [Candidatus Diapherotrites archaeon]|nr:hypothetical protein [Candidatus Diapherotrites archaeon]
MEVAKQQALLAEFVKEKETVINEIARKYVDLFNDCGRKYNDVGIQSAFTMVVIAQFLKSSNMPEKAKRELLKSLQSEVGYPTSSI